MPEKKKKLSDKEQRARFEAEVKRMIAAGELNPTDAEKVLSKLVRHAAKTTD